jgi:type II secretory ATPase GspE/PulE/Tfp pilus assembly ATPase PilB-like protein
VLAQRLVRTLCSACKESYHPDAEAFEELRHAYGPEAFDTLEIRYTPDFLLYRGAGCPQCSNTGYKGRVGIHELLVNTDEIKRFIQTRSRTTEILQAAQHDGMTTLLQDGIQKALRGVTDFAQVKAVASK